MKRFSIRVEQDDLAFSAAHFLAFAPGQRERLHGHDYRVAAEVQAPLGPSHFVLDFLQLQAILRELLAELDHRVLLPTNHPHLTFSVDEEEVEVRCGGQRWVFPGEDCRLLPLPSTTTELLAQYLAQSLQKRLTEQAECRPERICLQLYECRGYSASCELFVG